MNKNPLRLLAGSIILLVGFGLLLRQPTPATEPTTAKSVATILSLDSPAGLQVTISNIEGIDTADASAKAEFTRENANGFCTAKGDHSSTCVQNILDRTSVTAKITMNCRSGDFTDVFNIQSRLVKTGDSSGVEYSIVGPDGGQKSTDYESRINLIKLLCPSLIQEPIRTIVLRYFNAPDNNPLDVRSAQNSRQEVGQCNDQGTKDVLLNAIRQSKEHAVKQLEKIIRENSKTAQPPVVEQMRAAIDALEAQKRGESDAIKRWQIDNQIHFKKLDLQKAEDGIRELPRTIEYMKTRLDRLNRIIPKVINIRQQRYDETNNVRYCSGEFSPLEDMAEFGKVDLINRPYDILFSNPFTSVCSGSFDYKIEAILDEPDKNYVTSKCYRTLP